MTQSLKLITFFLLLTLSSYSFGQFGGLIKKPKKPKISAPKIGKLKSNNSSSNSNSTTSTKSNSTSSTSSANSTTASTEDDRMKDGAPKYHSDNPNLKTYSNARDNLKYAQGVMESIEWKHNPESAQRSAAKYLTKAKTALDALNAAPSEQDRAYLKEFNERYTVLNTKCTNETSILNKKKTYEANLQAYRDWAIYDRYEEGSSLELTPQGFYKEVENYKKEFPETFENSNDAQNIFKKVNDYLKTNIYKEITKVDEEASEIIKIMYLQNKWEGHDNYKIEAKTYLRRLNNLLPKIPADNKLEDKTTVNALKTKITKETTMLTAYLESGQLEVNLKQRQQEWTDAVRLNKKAMSNSTYEKMAMDRTFNDGAKMLRAVIVSKDWQVVKNGLDIPKHKSLWYSIAIKDKDGVCYKASGELRKDYEGGGKYGPPKFLFSERDQEMNCKNVHK